jgi:hypothetical protein
MSTLKISEAGSEQFPMVWRQRSREGRTVLELLNYVVWGNGSVSARLWNAIRSDDWAIPHIGLSSLGEIVGWARPEECPPRNMRTSKGLRALGYNVRIGVWLRLPAALVGSRSNLYLSPDRTAPALSGKVSHINRPADRWMLTLDFWHGRRSILQSLARTSSSEAA